MQRVVHARGVDMNRDGVPRQHHVQVDGRPAAVVAVRDGQAGRWSSEARSAAAAQRAVPSAAILQMLYVRRNGQTPWLSPRGRPRRRHDGHRACRPRWTSSARRPGPAGDAPSDGPARRCSPPGRIASRWSWPPRSSGHSPRPVGRPPTSPDARSTDTHSTPAASSSLRAAASVNRAAPMTRLVRASAVASGRGDLAGHAGDDDGGDRAIPFGLMHLRSRYAAAVHLFAAYLRGRAGPRPHGRGP